VSFAIPTVSPITVTGATIEPVAGSITTLNSSTPVVITDPAATNAPVVITGTGTMAVGTQQAQVVIQGDSNINVGIARDSSGNPLGMGGAVIQATDTSGGSKIVNLDGANIGGAKVSGNVDLSAMGGAGTIADNAPPGTFNGTPDTYIHTGAGNDQIQGSSGIDFIRAGAGNDTINAGAGDDIVRPGAGTDLITLGQGNDVVYLTVDQLQGTSTNTISDFKVNGADKIQIASDLRGLVSISGQGTQQIVISLSGAQTGTTTIVSQGQTINDDDIEFV
jgi:Ca2+-binding RTX toxin-like protein